MRDIKEFKKTRITLDELGIILAKGDTLLSTKYKNVKYDDFFKKVTKLIDEGVLVPCGKATNLKSNPLHLKYTINKNDKNIPLNTEELSFMANLHPTINPNYFRKNTDEFRKYRDYIYMIDKYLKESSLNNDFEYISINERSYQIFKDEKFIKNSNGLGFKLLKNLGLNLEDIRCYDNYQPLLTLTMPGFFTKKIKTVLIVENLDTYWTINRLLIDCNELLKDSIDMLVYGQGNAIVGAFENYNRYNINTEDNILYFGDIDNHGFFIYNQFKNRYKELNISLACKWYELILINTDIKNLKSVRTDNQKKLSVDNLSYILKDFSKAYKRNIIDILSRCEYIPQEALNYSLIRKNIDYILSKGGYINE